MKLSFSTNGWNVSFIEIVQLCHDNKVGGLEIHDINNFNKEKPFDRNNYQKTNKTLIENDVVISCFDSISNLAD